MTPSGRVRDGAFESARFYRPQGLALDRDVSASTSPTRRIIVASRRRSRRRARVTTSPAPASRAAGAATGGAALETALNSPWDLALDGRLLFVAMAGTHQIWIVDLDRGSWRLPYAGSGREARADGIGRRRGVCAAVRAGDRRRARCSSPTPSRTSSARSRCRRRIDVRTLVGGDLFEFGDRDGVGDDVRLQHPLGVAVAPAAALFIADTYNHRIKRARRRDAARRGIRRQRRGRARPTVRPQPATFYEPGGISATSDALFVADTNNHAIRRMRSRDAGCRARLECPVGAAAGGRTFRSALPGLKARPPAESPEGPAALLPSHLPSSPPPSLSCSIPPCALASSPSSPPRRRRLSRRCLDRGRRGSGRPWKRRRRVHQDARVCHRAHARARHRRHRRARAGGPDVVIQRRQHRGDGPERVDAGAGGRDDDRSDGQERDPRARDAARAHCITRSGRASTASSASASPGSISPAA